MLSRSDGRWTLAVSLVALSLLGWGLLTRGPLPHEAFEEPQSSTVRGDVIDLNRAGAPRLEALPGIGPTLAERIVRQRIMDGPYRAVDDLIRVQGIGPQVLRGLRPHVRTCGPVGCR